MNMMPLFLGDVAGSEIVVILIVILLFFGSKSIPGIAKTLGQAMYQIRNASNELQQEIKKSGVDIKSNMNIDALLKESKEQLVQPLDQMYSDVENSMHYTGKPQTPIERAEQVEANETETAAIEAAADVATTVEPTSEEIPVSETNEPTKTAE